MNFNSLLHNPLVIYLAVFVFASLLYALPKPGPQTFWGYVWLYQTLHMLGANWDKVTASIKAASGAKEPLSAEAEAAYTLAALSVLSAERARSPTVEIQQAVSAPQTINQMPETVERK